MIFLSQAAKNLKYSGSNFPYSEKLADLIFDETKIENAKIVVELEPSNGTLTKEIVSKKNSGTKFLAIETDEYFVNNLIQEFPNLKIYHDSTENISQCLEKSGSNYCDRVIASLPWTAFEGSFRRILVGNVANVLESGGMFTFFSYCPLDVLPDGEIFKKILQKNFSKVTETKITTNVPPAFVCICTK